MITIKNQVTQYFKDGKFDEGMEFLKSHRNELSDGEVFECEGDYNFYLGDFKAAIQKYETGITKHPTHLIARYQYLVGIQEEKEQNYVAAFKRYQSAIDIDHNFVDSYVELGSLLLKIGDNVGAAQCFRDAVKLAPMDLTNHHNLKVVIGKLMAESPNEYAKEYASVISAYEAVAKNPESKPITQNRW